MARTVQQFEVSLGPSDTSADTTITAVTTSKTLCLCTGIRSDVDDGLNEWRRQLVKVELTSTTNVRVERSNDAGGGETNTLTYVVQVVEDDDFSVQRGEETTSSYPNNITIASVNISQSAAFVQCEGDVGNDNKMAFVPASDHTSSTNLQLDILSGSAQLFGSGKSWQVVECTRWATQSIYKTEGISSYPHTETITSVDTSKSFVTGWGLRRYDNQTFDDDILNAYLDSSTALAYDSYDRANFNYCLDGWIIEDSGAIVQRGQTEITTSSTVDETITSVNTAQSHVVTGGANHQSHQSDTSDDIESKYHSTALLLGSSTLRLQREDNTTTGSTVYWEVVSLGGTRIADLMPFMPY